MKYMITVLFTFMVLAGCGAQSDQDSQQTDNKPDETAADAETNGDVDHDKASDNETVNIAFKNIDIKINNKKNVRIKGEAKSSNEKAYYQILHNDVIVGETEIELEGEKWTSFDIDLTLPEDVIETEEVPVLMVYGKTEGGKEVNPNYFGIDFIRQSF